MSHICTGNIRTIKLLTFNIKKIIIYITLQRTDVLLGQHTHIQTKEMSHTVFKYKMSGYS